MRRKRKSERMRCWNRELKRKRERDMKEKMKKEMLKIK
jgi:hypothetical protein